MPKVSDRHIKTLRPWLEGAGARPNGEWDLHCPLHEDVKRSASINIFTGEWHCFSCGSGGGIIDLIRNKKYWVENEGGGSSNGAVVRRAPSDQTQEVITMAKIDGWHSYLMSEETVLNDLITQKGVHTKTISDYRIGYDQEKRVYTIPVFGPDGEIWNVRRYNLYAPDTRRKIWSVAGMRSTELYPISQLDTDRIVICEGEWDTLNTIQNGYAAITRTGAADVWKGEWSGLFKDKTVYLAHDADEKGQTANRKVARFLRRIADVRICKLPFPIVQKHGEDLSDYWANYDQSDFEQMLSEAEPYASTKSKDPEIITVLDSFDSHKVGDTVKLQVTIKGKKDPGYSIPRVAVMSCTKDRGPVCQICPLNSAGGQAKYEIDPSSPAVLSLIDASASNLVLGLSSAYGIPGGKCPKLEIEVTDHQAVEVLFARPSIDHSDGTQARDYKNITLTSVGRHDTLPNNTVVVTGALYPSPKDQRNEFLAWEVARQETSVDKFEVTPDAIRQMKLFRPTGKQTPLQKLGVINRDLSTHVTKIVGRPEMHAMMDLVWHSVLQWKFGGGFIHRGWLEGLIVGDTRTGKSEVAERLVRHYGAGEIVGGEAATIAGLVGGLQQIGGKDWATTWGVIPLNDRRIVVIDELSGLSPEDISKMSDVRASGMARLTKIQQEVTFARTRLLWLGNPRNGGLDQYTHGVDAIKPLIGNPEDIARFDIAMAVARGDVAAEDFNRRIGEGTLKYPSDACHTMLMWCWTRQPDEVVWAKGAEDQVYKLALSFGARYVEDPPIVQMANARIKIARVAVALAARTFSTDDTFTKVIVTKQHVTDAVTFFDLLYGMPAFGYLERSQERIGDISDANDNKEKIRKYLLENRGLAKFLRGSSKFRRQDLEEVLNRDRDSANAIISKLWENRMIRKQGPDNVVEPTLHELLREVRW